ncbi:MAG: M17 family metallopeptidase [Bacteroidota bacterium]
MQPTDTHSNTDVFTLRVLTPEEEELSGILTPNAYLRTLEPNGFVLRLPKKATAAKVRGLGRLLSHKEAKQFKPKVRIVGGTASDEHLLALLGGLRLGTYFSGHWREEQPVHPLKQEWDITVDRVLDEAATLREHALAETQLSIMALVDAPANKKRPQDLAAWAVASGKEHGYQVRVLDEKECAAENFGGLLGVNRGSEDPARFIIMEYKGAGAPTDEGPVAIIGKGVTFDTGGLSIKPSTNMHLMKSDMGGAAATFGALEAAARLKLPVHLIGIVPSTDNSVDALSIKPSDVLVGHSGKSIEIIDTDAEGRLAMSDGLSYAVQNYAPSVLVDIATLTGSAVRTFGYACAAMISKDEELVASFRRAGDTCGERVWPLPPWDDYKSGLDSDVADIKNYSGKPINGAIDAFKFLEIFTHEHPHFIHFDIAGVALTQGPFAKDRQATGFGMRLFVEWLSNK